MCYTDYFFSSFQQFVHINKCPNFRVLTIDVFLNLTSFKRAKRQMFKHADKITIKNAKIRTLRCPLRQYRTTLHSYREENDVLFFMFLNTVLNSHISSIEGFAL